MTISHMIHMIIFISLSQFRYLPLGWPDIGNTRRDEIRLRFLKIRKQRTGVFLPWVCPLVLLRMIARIRHSST